LGQLKHNPKRSKRKTSEEEEEYSPPKKSAYDKSRTTIWMIFIFIAVSGIVILMIFITYNPRERIIVEDHDVINIDYTIWKQENNTYNYSNPFIVVNNALLNVTSRYEENITDGLILGFYNELLGKTALFSKTFSINATVDIDKDGIDDIKKQDALGYGFPEDELFNTSIIISYKILAIQKWNQSAVGISLEKNIRLSQNYIKNLKKLGFQIFCFNIINIICY
jgi:hypothetical protein